MKIIDTRKLFTLAFSGLLLASGAAAEDFDFGSGDFSFESSDTGSSSSQTVEVTGSVEASARGYVADTDSAADMEVSGGADADLSVSYSGTKADATVSFNLNEDTITNHPEDVIDEAYVSAYLGNFTLEAGKMKNVWGKGDKLHVIDNFNADDYTDFIIPDYLDRRIATPMVKGSYSFGYNGNVLSNMKIEGVYTPFLPVDRFSTDTRWTPDQVKEITDRVTDDATDFVADAFTEYTTQTATVAALKSIQADATAAASAKATAKSSYEALNALKAAYPTNTYVYYNILKGTSLTAEQFDTLCSQALAAYAAATVNDSTASKEYEAALEEAGVSTIEEAEENLKAAGSSYMYALNNASLLSSDTSILYPDTSTLKYGQAGARFTYSLGPVDLGMSYYYGHYKQPSFNEEKYSQWIAKYLGNEDITDDDKFLAYDQKQTFGIEAATILWHFNLRGEACYNLTEDTDGTNPWVHNNSVQWLGGFDIDMPFWNMNINIQETGTYILGNENITGSTYETKDVDYNVNGYSNNKIVANITTSFLNDRICPEVTALYGIENGDLAVMPKLSVSPAGGLTLSASGLYLWCRDDNSEFAAWKNNSFVQLGAKVTF